MPSSLATFPRNNSEPKSYSQQLTVSDTERAEQQFIYLLTLDNLDNSLERRAADTSDFDAILAAALTAAYAGEAGCDVAHRFLQRVLYRINRLKLFWYDDLRRYDNERSAYLREIRDRIEDGWQRWERAKIKIVELQKTDVRKALLERAAADLAPEPSGDGRYFRDQVMETGYRRLLAIASLDGLVEASQLSRTLGGVGNEIHSVLTRLLLEEYGGGNLNRKHSSFFTVMLSELGMETAPEAYFDLVPWEVLAAINHSFLLSERKRYFLRYIGGLLYTEVSVPAAFGNYRAAASRLGLSPAAMGYWDLHIKEDERHGRWMLHDIALPLADRYEADSWELLFGYDQQKLLSERAGASIARAAREAEQGAQLTFKVGGR